MTAERLLHETLWNRLPTFVKNTILDSVSKGRFKCTIPDETLRNVDIMDMNGALRYLGYNIHRKRAPMSVAPLISWLRNKPPYVEVRRLFLFISLAFPCISNRGRCHL
jgi:hypothetical protein